MATFSLDNLAKAADSQAEYDLDSWSPALSGDIDIYIDSAGLWYHEGQLFERQEIVKLFARLLTCEQGEYFLKTPVEKWRIRVASTPFVVNDIRFSRPLRSIDQQYSPSDIQNEALDEFAIADISCLGQVRFTAGDWFVKQLDDAVIPAIALNYGLTARLSRALYYEFAQQYVEDKKGELGISSPLGWLPFE